MSSGKIIAPAVTPTVVHTAAISSGLTTAATVAGVALLSVAAAAAAVVITRATMSGMAFVGERIESDAAAWKEEQAAAEAWHEAVLDVIDHNSRLAAIGAAHRRLGGTGAGPDPDLPTPLNPAGRTLDEMRAWCREVDARIPAANARLTESTIAGGLSWLGTLPGQGRLKTAVEALADRQIVLRLRPAEAPVATSAAGKIATTKDGAEFEADVDRILARLPADVTKEACGRVMEAGAQVLSAATETTARAWLNELRVRAQQATQEAAERSKDVKAAARYLAALRLEEISAELFPPEDTARFAAVRTRLEAVVDGAAELTTRLRIAADDAVQRAQDLADRCLLRESLRAGLMDLGYAVDLRSSVDGDEVLTARRDGWGEHVVTFELSGEQLHADFRRAGSDDVTLVDLACLERWRQDYPSLAAEAAQLGVKLHLVEVKIPDPPEHDASAQDAAEREERSRPAHVRYREQPR